MAAVVRALRMFVRSVARPRVVAALLRYQVILDDPHVSPRPGGPLARLDHLHLDMSEVAILTCLPLAVIHVLFEFLRG